MARVKQELVINNNKIDLLVAKIEEKDKKINKLENKVNELGEKVCFNFIGYTKFPSNFETFLTTKAVFFSFLLKHFYYYMQRKHKFW